MSTGINMMYTLLKNEAKRGRLNEVFNLEVHGKLFPVKTEIKQNVSKE